jgi:predicted nucleotidyltransferase
MAKKPPSPFVVSAGARLLGCPDIPLRVIRRYARAIAEEFDADKIILLGSFAYGTPHKDSDVDLLVIMPCRDRHAQAVRILWRLSAPFPLDLLVRTPHDIKSRLEEGESFTTTIMTRGMVLYEKENTQMGRKGRGRLRGRPARQPRHVGEVPPNVRA